MLDKIQYPFSVIRAFLKSGFGVFVDCLGIHQYPKISFFAALGRESKEGTARLSDFRKAMLGNLLNLLNEAKGDGGVSRTEKAIH